MKTIQRVHRTHFLLNTPECVVSFNPASKSIADMLAGNYSVATLAPAHYNNPYKNNFGQMVCTESTLAYNLE